MPPEASEKRRLRRSEASEYLLRTHGLSMKVSTLATLASKGGDGPPYHKAGKVPLYPVNELDSWASRRLGALVRNTTEAEAARKGAA